MAKKNRVTFKTSISAKFFTNILKLIKGNTLRDAMLDTADSFLNIDSDANVNGGYMAIDNAGKTDVTKIRQDTPVGHFARDDGSFAEPIAGAITMFKYYNYL